VRHHVAILAISKNKKIKYNIFIKKNKRKKNEKEKI